MFRGGSVNLFGPVFLEAKAYGVENTTRSLYDVFGEEFRNNVLDTIAYGFALYAGEHGFSPVEAPMSIFGPDIPGSLRYTFADLSGTSREKALNVLVELLKRYLRGLGIVAGQVQGKWEAEDREARVSGFELVLGDMVLARIGITSEVSSIGSMQLFSIEVSFLGPLAEVLPGIGRKEFIEVLKQRLEDLESSVYEAHPDPHVTVRFEGPLAREFRVAVGERKLPFSGTGIFYRDTWVLEDLYEVVVGRGARAVVLVDGVEYGVVEFPEPALVRLRNCSNEYTVERRNLFSLIHRKRAREEKRGGLAR